jgi:hypothetical protein
MQQVSQALAGATLAAGPATAAERAATGVDTYLVDSDTEDAETTSSAIDDFERRLAARQPQPTAATTTAAPPPTNSKSRVQR